MSRLKKINLLGLILLGLFAGKFVMAKTLQFEDKTWDIIPSFTSLTTAPTIDQPSDLVLLSKQSILGTPNLASQRLLSPETITQLDEIAKTLNQDPRDAKFVVENNKATTFDPGQNGQGLDLYKTLKLLNSDEASLTLPVILSKPQTTLDKTNSLGINELVAIGESDFKGSPKNRIHNINVGASKFDGIIVAQGEEFSFNKYLGEVDDVNGFLPELVIKATGVTPEYGGGLCQVSSTAFRGAMNAGFPITARRNHSFAVQYYAPQGTDATIYPGVSDMKFINDSPGPILVHTRIDGTKLYFEYYGRKDNRSVSFDGPVQYDKKTDGSMKATWTRHVTQNGETKTQEFKSTYLPPALFHKEESPPTTTPSVPAPPPPPPTT